ncbi:MAG TPA: hypothetical protein VGP28_01975 [Methylocella sp.]|nr:hypothetical protein [Methylocella sp.]
MRAHREETAYDDPPDDAQVLRDARCQCLDRECGGRSAAQSEDHAVLTLLDGPCGGHALRPFQL